MLPCFLGHGRVKVMSSLQRKRRLEEQTGHHRYMEGFHTGRRTGLGIQMTAAKCGRL